MAIHCALSTKTKTKQPGSWSPDRRCRTRVIEEDKTPRSSQSPSYVSPTLAARPPHHIRNSPWHSDRTMRSARFALLLCLLIIGSCSAADGDGFHTLRASSIEALYGAELGRLFRLTRPLAGRGDCGASLTVAPFFLSTSPPPGRHQLRSSVAFLARSLARAPRRTR